MEEAKREWVEEAYVPESVEPSGPEPTSEGVAAVESSEEILVASPVHEESISGVVSSEIQEIRTIGTSAESTLSRKRPAEEELSDIDNVAAKVQRGAGRRCR